MALTRRNFLTTSTAALAAGTLGRTLWPGFTLSAHGFGKLEGQGQRPAPTPVFTELRRNVGTFTMQGGTIGWLVNPGGAVAVDSQFPASAQVCVDELLKRSAKAQIPMLINTHHHGDHTAGNGVFRPKTTSIIGHVNVPKYMEAAHKQNLDRRSRQNPPPTTPAPPAPVVPDKTFTDTWGADHGDERVSAKHYGPAHTGGDIVIRFEKANVAHMGDLMFNRMHPVIDRANGASIANWSKVLRAVTSELPADTIYIFGHAGANFPVTGARADLLHHASYLEALLEHVRTHVKAGKTREDVIALRDLIKGFEDYGPLTERPLGPAYDEVTAG